MLLQKEAGIWSLGLSRSQSSLPSIAHALSTNSGARDTAANQTVLSLRNSWFAGKWTQKQALQRLGDLL